MNGLYLYKSSASTTIKLTVKINGNHLEYQNRFNQMIKASYNPNRLVTDFQDSDTRIITGNEYTIYTSRVF